MTAGGSLNEMELLAAFIRGRSMMARGSSVVVAFRLARQRDAKHPCGHHGQCCNGGGFDQK